MIDLVQIEDTIGYHFRNLDLLQQAFVRRSYSEENGGQNNEVLEFIGDKALDLAVIKIMMEYFGQITDTKEYKEFRYTLPKRFRNFVNLEEGDYTDIKKALVQKKALARCIEKLGFHTQLIVGKGDIKQNIFEQDSVKEDLFEAIVGAVAVDSNYDMDFITDVVENMIDFRSFFLGKENDLDNYVGVLQEWSQKEGYGLPKYTYSEQTLEGTYICHVVIEGDDGFRYKEDGKGLSKAEARMDAAYRAYKYLYEKEFIPNKYEEAVGEPIREEAIRQINELFQKKLIAKPEYEFYEDHDEDGNTFWICTLYIDGYKVCDSHNAFTKKEAQRECAYEFLCCLMDYEYEEE